MMPSRDNIYGSSVSTHADPSGKSCCPSFVVASVASAGMDVWALLTVSSWSHNWAISFSISSWVFCAVLDAAYDGLNEVSEAGCDTGCA